MICGLRPPGSWLHSMNEHTRQGRSMTIMLFTRPEPTAILGSPTRHVRRYKSCFRPKWPSKYRGALAPRLLEVVLCPSNIVAARIIQVVNTFLNFKFHGAKQQRLVPRTHRREPICYINARCECRPTGSSTRWICCGPLLPDPLYGLDRQLVRQCSEGQGSCRHHDSS